MKKIIKQLFVLVMSFVLLFSCFACEEYSYATIIPGGGGNSSSSGSLDFDEPTLDDDPTNDFTVTLTADGQPYSPRMEMAVYWRNKENGAVHAARVDKQGVARIDGLDGDYQVTLSAVPNEYSYDPNFYIATNDHKHVTLELYTLNRLTGSGTGLYDCYKFSKTGVYSAVIEKAGDGIYFEYAPDRSGTYSIESWIDTTEDKINPYVDVYGGHTQYKFFLETTNDGGAVGSYTINFVHNVQIAKENISSGGQATYTFVVKAETKNNKYPITVTFAVKRDGDFELNTPGVIAGPKVLKIPTYDFSQYNVADHEYGAGYKIVYPEERHSTGVYIFNENKFKLWDSYDGGDDFYHVYDEVKYADNGGYGPILYANITTACRFVDRSFNCLEYRGGTKEGGGTTDNGALTLGSVNYKHFIEGYSFLSTYGLVNGGAYYCASDCGCHDLDVSDLNWACPEGCASCNSNCRLVPAAGIGNEGYQSIANSKGLVAVTKELREFLLAYAYDSGANFFYDGQGSLETAHNIQAQGDSGWLFACCYYEEN